MSEAPPGGERPASPCVRLCRLDDAGGLCLGCGRRLDEIVRWASMDATEKAAVWRRLDDLGR
jgi:uncharacterized protein